MANQGVDEGGEDQVPPVPADIDAADQSEGGSRATSVEPSPDASDGGAGDSDVTVPAGTDAAGQREGGGGAASGGTSSDAGDGGADQLTPVRAQQTGGGGGADLHAASGGVTSAAADDGSESLTPVPAARTARSANDPQAASGGATSAAGDAADQQAVPSRSVTRAVVNVTDVTVGYSVAAARAGVSAALGMGRATSAVVGGMVERSPIGSAAAAVADALEPTAVRARKQSDESAAEILAVVQAVVGQVVDQVIGVININGIVQDVDIDRIVQGIDINAIVQGIDIEGIVQKIDINGIVDEIDIDQIVSTTEIGSLIVQSTGGVATETLDVVRSQGVSLDGVITRLADRLVRRDDGPRPEAPKYLTQAADEQQEDEGGPSAAEPS